MLGVFGRAQLSKCEVGNGCLHGAKHPKNQNVLFGYRNPSQRSWQQVSVQRSKQSESRMKAKMVLIMVVGLIGLLAVIVIGDFYIAIRENKSPDESVIQLLQHAIVGFIGVISGYVAGKENGS